MGRRKIAIEPLTDDRNRTVTFTKRKAGLFKKAHELAILCEIDISVIIIGRNHKVYEYSSSDPSEILDRFEAYKNNIQESKRPQNYGNYETKSRILDSTKLKNTSYSQRLHNEIKTEVDGKSKTVGSNNQRRSYSLSEKNNQIESDYDSTEDGDDSTVVKNSNLDTAPSFEEESHYDNQDQSTTSSGLTETKRSSRKRLQDLKQESISKKSKRSENIEVVPTTPENHFQNPTAISDTDSAAYRTPSVLRNSKSKDNKRPTLSLKIPTMDNDIDKSNGSTITVTNSSSNKSNNLNTLSGNRDTKGRKEIRIDDKKDVIIPSPVYNVTDSSSDHSANIKMQTMDNSTPLPSALFKDKRIYTPLSTTFMNNLNMIPSAGGSSGNADLAQLGYFNFIMSPTQVLTPVFPFTQNHNTMKQANNKQSNSENQIPHRGSADDIRRGKLRQQFQVQSYKSGQNGLSIQNSQIPLQSPKIQLLQQGLPQPVSEVQTKNQSQSQSHSQQQPYLPHMNSATSMYFPQMRGNTMRPLPPSANNSLNGTELPTLSTIGNNNVTNYQTQNQTQTQTPVSGEISGLPSRYVEFQSPTTLFNNQDWSLPTGTTPVLTQPNTSHNFQSKKDGDTTSDETILDKTQ